MGLSTHDQRVLAQIEQQLSTEDPRLARLLGRPAGSTSPRHRTATGMRRFLGPLCPSWWHRAADRSDDRSDG
ncbi:DUF3040 domain-containing protein [Kitasatospora mediocidica]|uniref:DUF3040 domain-containing protein n=1 Tax=Kitasatospora mediocidica TaxID=58352 RepID=UPI0005644C17|nr:DUF3040 domain-containing protein [Kitasatospora mediocidica]